MICPSLIPLISTLAHLKIIGGRAVLISFERESFEPLHSAPSMEIPLTKKQSSLKISPSLKREA